MFLSDVEVQRDSGGIIAGGSRSNAGFGVAVLRGLTFKEKMMANMSYCRFQNTLQDLRDCYENMDDNDLSDEEKRARRALLKLCDQIAGDYVVEGEPTC